MSYNKLEMKLSKYPDWKKPGRNLKFWEKTKIFSHNIRNWLNKYDQFNRLIIFLIAFEVYLTWVSEETKYYKYRNDFKATKELLIYEVLQGSVTFQYLYFFLIVCVEFIVLHSVIQFVLLKIWGWGSELKYKKDIISYTIVVSYGAKIFPILMVIWPYDTLLSTTIIKFIANIYVVEAVKIVTRKSYFKISLLFSGALLLRYITVKLILFLMMSNFDSAKFSRYAASEYELLLFRMYTKKSLYL